MDPLIEFELLEGRLHKILSRYRLLEQKRPGIRPFAVEFFGTPKAGKTTIMTTVLQLLKRHEWEITARPEGAEVVDQPRTGPQYNEQTWRYAMSELYQRQQSRFEVVLLDRGLMDNLIWMDYWRKKGKLDAEVQKLGEAFKLSPLYRDMFDLHICMVCEPETAMEREVAMALSKKDGDTMNLRSLRSLRDSHDKLWERVGGEADPRIVWHDSTTESPQETAIAVLHQIAKAFELGLERRV